MKESIKDIIVCTRSYEELIHHVRLLESLGVVLGYPEIYNMDARYDKIIYGSSRIEIHFSCELYGRKKINLAEFYRYYLNKVLKIK